MTPKRARKAKAARKPARKAAPKAAALIEVMVQSPRWKKQPRAAAIVRNAVAAAAKAAPHVDPRPSGDLYDRMYGGGQDIYDQMYD